MFSDRRTSFYVIYYIYKIVESIDYDRYLVWMNREIDNHSLKHGNRAISSLMMFEAILRDMHQSLFSILMKVIWRSFERSFR